MEGKSGDVPNKLVKGLILPSEPIHLQIDLQKIAWILQFFWCAKILFKNNYNSDASCGEGEDGKWYDDGDKD